MIYYAIGDVHGEDDKLARLHDFIFDDASRLGGAFEIVHLGDLIDRGAKSRDVVARVMAMEQNHASCCIKGNHEAMLLKAIDSEDSKATYDWALNGGAATQMSYEAVHGEHVNWRDALDRPHVKWLRSLKLMRFDEGRRILFVHAGIDPKRYPDCDEAVMLWTRSKSFFDVTQWPERAELEGLLVVHGHTPTEDDEPEIFDQRINVDTGACFGGPLTCVALAPGEKPRFLRAA
jgi:serine/threonine protein phosphatase 1